MPEHDPLPQEPPNQPNELGAALRNGRVLTLIFVCLTVAFTYGYYQRTQVAADVAAEIENKEAMIAAAQQRTAELQAELRYVASDDFLDKIAREELGLAKPNETALVLLKRPGPSAPALDNPADDTHGNESLRTSEAQTQAIPAQPQHESTSAGSTASDAPPVWQAWIDLLTPDDRR